MARKYCIILNAYSTYKSLKLKPFETFIFYPVLHTQAIDLKKKKEGNLHLPCTLLSHTAGISLLGKMILLASAMPENGKNQHTVYFALFATERSLPPP